DDRRRVGDQEIAVLEARHLAEGTGFLELRRAALGAGHHQFEVEALLGGGRHGLENIGRHGGAVDDHDASPSSDVAASGSLSRYTPLKSSGSAGLLCRRITTRPCLASPRATARTWPNSLRQPSASTARATSSGDT